jgi:hypothetical protein
MVYVYILADLKVRVHVHVGFIVTLHSHKTSYEQACLLDPNPKFGTSPTWTGFAGGCMSPFILVMQT